MNRKKKREMPLTAILLGIVLVLIAVLCVVVRMFITMTNEEHEQFQSEMIEADTGFLTEETEHLTECETQQLSESAELPTEVLESETMLMTEEGMIDITLEEVDTEQDTERVEADSESMSESQTEMDNETESDAESETEQDKLVVAIDPGHQGSWVDMSDKEPNGPGSTEMKMKATKGTQGRFSGKAEYELNLEVSLLLADELEKRGYDVILTRKDHDTAISNSERALKAYEEGGDIYVRIHANGSDDQSVDGALAMVPSPQNPYVGYLAKDSYLLGQCILEEYCSDAGFDSLGVQYYDNMTGINWSKIPVMILEMGFMTNESDDLQMADPDMQVLMAGGIADGIDAYFEQKGMKVQEVSAEDQAKVNTALEILSESYLYPAADAGETWAVSIKDINTGAVGNFRGDEQMKAASLIKVFIMATIYDRVCYPSSPERYIPYPESYTGELRQLITDMITVSDNTASNTLVKTLGGGDAKAGMAIVNQFCMENGYENTQMGRLFLESNPTGDNYTSANDCMNLLASIYDGTCVNEEASAKMLEYLRQQTRRGKIPAGLSGTGASVFNKTGELYGEYSDYVENDIAIVETGDTAFVLSIMSRNLVDNGNAVSKISEMAKLVYNEMN